MSAVATIAGATGRAPRATRDGHAGAIVIANPGRQHVYETALAAQEAGWLRAFATGVYVGGRDPMSRAVLLGSVFPGGRQLLRSAGNRIDSRLDAHRVVSFAWQPLLAHTVRATPWGQDAARWALRRCDARIARWLRRLDPCPALVHGFELGALETLRAAKALGLATVLDVPMAHEYGEIAAGAKHFGDRHSVRVRAERAAADHLLVPSEFVAGCLTEFGIARRRIVVVPYGAHLPRCVPARRDDGVFRAIFVGGICHRKGVDVLLEAWRRLALPHAELVLVGGAVGEGQALVERLAPGCRWAGRVPRSEVAHWYAQSDVFLFPSRAEGSALVTYEAMAAGLAVITTPAAGSVVRDGLDGLLVPVGDVDALAGRLALLHAHADLRGALGAEARRTIRERFTWAHYRRRMRGVYEAILESRNPADAVAGAPR